MNSQLWVVVLTGVSGLLGILLSQSYTKNISLRSELKTKKQKLYSDFIGFIFPIYYGDDIESHVVVDKLKFYFPKLLTFASNEVVKSTADFMQHMYAYDNETAKAGDYSWNISSMEYFGDLILAIRKDLGHKRLTEIMKWHDITRLWIKDIDQYLPASEQTPRASHPGPKYTIN